MSQSDVHATPDELCCDLAIPHGHCGFCGGPCSESSQYCGSLCPGSYIERLRMEGKLPLDGDEGVDGKATKE